MITVYTKNNCGQCTATKRALTARNIAYREINIDEDEAAAEKARSFGYMQAPVVIVDFTHETMGGEHWSGFRPDKVDQLS